MVPGNYRLFVACVNARSGEAGNADGRDFYLRPGNVVLLPQNSAHRLSHVIMNRPVLSAALFGCNIRRVIFNVFAGNAVFSTG